MVKLEEKYYSKNYANPFNWIGSKHRYLSYLFDKLPNQEHLKVLDSFVGGGDLISKLPESWDITAGDAMKECIDLHLAIQNGTINVGSILKGTSRYNLSKDNQESYLELRKEYNKNPEPFLLYLLLTCAYNNQTRFNSSGGFNNPFGRRIFNDSMQRKLNNYQESLQERNIKFENKSFDEYDFNCYDLVLLDPPYLNTDATYNSKWTVEIDNRLMDKIDECSDNTKFILFNQTVSKATNNENLINWSRKYNTTTLHDTSKGCSYNRNNIDTVEVMITNF